MPKRRTVAPAGWVAGRSRGSRSCDWRRARTRSPRRPGARHRRGHRDLRPRAPARALGRGHAGHRVDCRRPGWPRTRWCRSPATSGAPLLTAMAERAQGAVLLAEGDPRAALAALRPSWTAWQALDAPYEAARTRVLIGLACRALDDADAATLELDAAADAFRELGAGPDLARVEALLERAAAALGRWPHGPRARGASARRLRQDES